MGTDHVFWLARGIPAVAMRGKRGLSPLLLLLVVMLAAGQLSGCGFRMRGSADLPAAMRVTCIEGSRPYGTLADDFATALRLRNITVTDRRSAATACLHIINNDTAKVVVSVDTAGNVQEYEIRQTVRFSVLASDGSIVVPEQSVALARDYIFSSTDVLGKTREEQVVRATLQEILVNLAMLRISAAAR